MGKIILTDELLEYLGDKFDWETTDDFLKGVWNDETFASYVNKYLRKLAL